MLQYQFITYNILQEYAWQKLWFINCRKYIQKKDNIAINEDEKKQGIGSDLAATNVHGSDLLYAKTTQTLYRGSAARHTEHMLYIHTKTKLINLNVTNKSKLNKIEPSYDLPHTI